MMPHGRGKEGRTVFGYIRVRESELRVRELSLYRAAYCGLCRSLGRECGQVSRIYLSYDLTFMALVRAALDEFEALADQQPQGAEPVSPEPADDGAEPADVPKDDSEKEQSDEGQPTNENNAAE